MAIPSTLTNKPRLRHRIPIRSHIRPRPAYYRSQSLMPAVSLILLPSTAAGSVLHSCRQCAARCPAQLQMMPRSTAGGVSVNCRRRPSQLQAAPQSLLHRLFHNQFIAAVQHPHDNQLQRLAYSADVGAIVTATAEKYEHEKQLETI